MHEILLSFGIIILAGAAFRALRPGGLEADDMRRAINVSVLNVFLPALCVEAMYSSHIEPGDLLVPAAAWVTTLGALAVSIAAYGLLRRRLGITLPEAGILVIAATFGNVTYLGLPVLRELLGQGAVKYALFFDLLATTPILWLIGAPVAARYGGQGGFDLSRSLRTIASLPPVWAIAVGVGLNLSGIGLPGFLLRALGLISGPVVPLMIFSVGLAFRVPRVRAWVALFPAVIIKLALVPAVSYFAARTLGLEGTALSACLLEGAMPTMVLSMLIAGRFGLDEELAAFAIVTTTVLSFFTVPFSMLLAGQ